MPLDSTRKPQRRHDLSVHESEGAFHVVDPGGTPLFRLNDTARALWDVCDGETSIDEMIDAAGQLFAAPSPVLRADVISAIEEFYAMGLLEAEQ